ncbi:MAG TPA: ABC transporter ATP-binding protein, partial [Desulfobulbaceae bacterium]|nr:ABC transporter ATP-binding protein [Desulfobulbaceae bacterium]
MIPDTGVGMAVIGHMVNVTSARRHILRQCSFSFPTGQCTAILGPNGAGKTTLLGLANGLTTIHSGSVTALGLPVNSRNVRSLRQRIGYVAQWRFIDPRQPITVFESVLSGTYGKLGLFRKPGESETRLAAEALAAVAASHLATRPL